MTNFHKEQVSGHWVHSFEEDNPNEMIYRSKGFAFPRSRGRRAFDLQPDGKIIDVGPGRADLPEVVAGDWTLEQEALIINYPDGTGERMSVKEVTPEKLVIRKV